MTTTDQQPEAARQEMQVDIICTGFGPATGGFLTTLSRAMTKEDGTPAFESKVMPGMLPQVICYERADDIGFGVSGVVTKAKSIRESFPDFDPAAIPMTHEVTEEKVVYLLDPVGASRRSWLVKVADNAIKLFKWILPYRHQAMELPWMPPFLQKHKGIITSIGQFNQWVGNQLMMSGAVQIWPGTPVAKPLIEDNKVTGVQLADQGTDKQGNPEAGYTPGMDIKAALTVVGDGPVGVVGRDLDLHFGLPEGNHIRDWAVGMKMVVDLPAGCELKPGTVIHTLGYPEPEIFGFMYVYPDGVASLGIFVPSWFDNPMRSTYRYMQHWIQHPYLWRHLEGGTLRSWGAKSLQESGRRGEPFLVGDGYARIGEGSGTTNVLTNSGVDEAWESGVQLADAVIELLEKDKPFTKENLDETYVKRRRASWLDSESRIAQHARDGFQKGFITGMFTTALVGMTKGKLFIPFKAKRPHDRIPTPEEYYKGRISAEEIDQIRKECRSKGLTLHDRLMEKAGWPEIKNDGQLLMSHQDILLMGGKVQATGNYADHVTFVDPRSCAQCQTLICTEICSGQAIAPNPEGLGVVFDREKCVYCGACIWSCSEANKDNPEYSNVSFRAGAGGLHSAEN
ncbi:MAG: 4Fe-4S ferredoxin [Gammaproteobacteria bacterium]|nr:4Fe-4S ferredoxin [Gammaproteobacteria bacterium]